MVWSGQCGVSAYRLFAQLENYTQIGTCEPEETCDINLKTPEGCGANEAFSVSDPFPPYFATVTFSRKDLDNNLITKEITSSSIISENDAYRKAAKTAEWYVLSQIGEII